MTITPIIKIDSFYFKREDLNKTGSAKDRAIIKQIKEIKKRKLDQAVISSTGNAALSAAYFCQENNIKLTIFLSPKVNLKKLKLLKKYSHKIEISKKPISGAIKFSKNNPAYLLRQSTDPVALIGYQQIATEIKQQLPQITSLFVPVGSGTTLLGVSQQLPDNIKIFAVQSAANCPLAKKFDSNYRSEKQLLTDALSAKFLPQKNKVIKTIKNRNSSAFVIQNQNIIETDTFLKKNKIKTSLEGALALAGLFKAQKNNVEIGDYPLILLTGAKR
jgi:threonine synthase